MIDVFEIKVLCSLLRRKVSFLSKQKKALSIISSAIDDACDTHPKKRNDSGKEIIPFLMTIDVIPY